MQTESTNQFVFVGGMHRSGTTLVAKLLGESETFSGFSDTGVQMDEGQFLQDIYLTGAQMGGVTRWAFDSRAHLTEEDVTPSLSDRLWHAWNPHWDLSARFLVEKTPLNLTKTRFLQAAFPRSSFIIVTRHPLTQALAIQKWSPTWRGKLGVGFPCLIDHWVRAHELFQDDASHLDRVLLVRYENLIHQPEVEIARMNDFLGTNRINAHSAPVDPTRVTAYAQRWDGMVTGTRRWGDFTRLARSTFQSRAALSASASYIAGTFLQPRYAPRVMTLEDRIRPLGYTFTDLSRPLNEG